MFRHYMRLIVFSLGLLTGIQIPALIDQYVKRVDAQLIEANTSLAGFKATADRYFNGSLQQLISHYRKSDDDVFNRDADNIEQLYNRQLSLQHHYQQLQASLPTQIWVLTVGSDASIMQRTLETYSYVVMLSPQAILVGLICALVLTILWDMLVLMMKVVFGHRKRRSEHFI